MFEVLLFGAAVWFWVLIGICIICFVTSEAREQGWISFLTLSILLGAVYNWGQDSTGAEVGLTWIKNIFTWQNVSLYLAAGLVFAGIRSIFYGKKMSREKQEDWARSESKRFPLSAGDKEEFKKSKYYMSLIEDVQLKDHFFRWWLNWPFSGLWWALSDWLTEFWHLVKRFYERLYKWGVDAAI